MAVDNVSEQNGGERKGMLKANAVPFQKEKKREMQDERNSLKDEYPDGKAWRQLKCWVKYRRGNGKRKILLEIKMNSPIRKGGSCDRRVGIVKGVDGFDALPQISLLWRLVRRAESVHQEKRVTSLLPGSRG